MAMLIIVSLFWKSNLTILHLKRFLGQLKKIGLNPLVLRFNKILNNQKMRINQMDDFKKLTFLKKDRSLYQKKLYKTQNKKNEVKIMSSFADQATKLLQVENLSIKLIFFEEKISNSVRKKYNQVWNILKYRNQLQHKTSQLIQQLKYKKFALKILSALNKKLYSCKIFAFKDIKQNKYKRTMDKLMEIQTKMKLKSAFESFKNLQKRNQLSILDISQIAAAEQFSHLNKHNHPDQQDKYEIDEQFDIVKESIENNNKIENNQLIHQKLRPNDQKILIQQQTKTKTNGNLSIMIKKLIKNNYELEEKLQIIYEILDQIQTDPSTKIGLMIQNLKRKKIGNLEFQNKW